MLLWTVCRSQHVYPSINKKGDSLLLLHIMTITCTFSRDNSRPILVSLEKCVIVMGLGSVCETVVHFRVCFQQTMSSFSVFKSMRFCRLFHACLCTFSCVFVINGNAFCGRLMRYRRTAFQMDGQAGRIAITLWRWAWLRRRTVSRLQSG